MAFVAGYVCGAAVVLLLLVLVAYMLHRADISPTPTDSHAATFFEESERFFQEFVESVSRKTRKEDER